MQSFDEATLYLLLDVEVSAFGLPSSADVGMNAQQLRPKEDLADTALFIAIVVVLVLVAGLMSGTQVSVKA